MSVPNRFGVLRFIGNLLKVVAWILLALSIVGAIGMAIAGSNLIPLLSGALDVNSMFAVNSGVIGGILLLFMGLVDFLIFYAIGEGIQMLLATEENTRLTAALLLRMHQDSQPVEEDPYAPGGFASEPFEP